MSQPTVYRYDPFELSQKSQRRWHAFVQRVVNYGEACLRVALIEMSRQAPSKQVWLQSYLHDELVRFWI